MRTRYTTLLLTAAISAAGLTACSEDNEPRSPLSPSPLGASTTAGMASTASYEPGMPGTPDTDDTTADRTRSSETAPESPGPGGAGTMPEMVIVGNLPPGVTEQALRNGVLTRMNTDGYYLEQAETTGAGTGDKRGRGNAHGIRRLQHQSDLEQSNRPSRPRAQYYGTWVVPRSPGRQVASRTQPRCRADNFPRPGSATWPLRHPTRSTNPGASRRPGETRPTEDR